MNSRALTLLYTADPTTSPRAPERAYAELVERAGRAGNRAAIVAASLDAACALPLPEEALQALRTGAPTGDGLQLAALTPDSPDPFRGAGWPALAVSCTGTVLQLALDDPRVGTLIYVPATPAELRHFQRAFSDAVPL